MSNIIRCKICSRQCNGYRGLSTHLRNSHCDITNRQYYNLYIKVDLTIGICNLENCNNETRFNGLKKGYCKFCCNSHAQLSKNVRYKIKKTKFIKYGDENYYNLEKSKQTRIDRYGDEFYNNSDKISRSLLSRTKDEIETWKIKVRKRWKEKQIKKFLR